jgi:hypothetical protein
MNLAVNGERQLTLSLTFALLGQGRVPRGFNDWPCREQTQHQEPK